MTAWKRSEAGKEATCTVIHSKGSNKPFCWTPFVIPKCSNTNLHPPTKRKLGGKKNVFWDSWIPFSKHPREHLSLRWHWHDSVLLWACSFASLTLQMHSDDFCSTIRTKKVWKLSLPRTKAVVSIHFPASQLVWISECVCVWSDGSWDREPLLTQRGVMR